MNDSTLLPRRPAAPLVPGGIAAALGAVAFDADDTLWDCQGAFLHAETRFRALLAPWATPAEAAQTLAATEQKNIPLTGYGAKAFTLSMVEAALQLMGTRPDSAVLGQVLQLGTHLMQLPARPLPGVEEALRRVRRAVSCPVVVFTKGELSGQEGKMARSGLRRWFDEVITVADKTPRAYTALCRRMGTRMDRLLMVGNSFRSDIDPVLRLGGWAAYVPYHATWAHEQMDEYSHPRLWQLSSLRGLTEEE